MAFTGAMPCWTLHLTTLGSALFINERMEHSACRGHLMLFHPQASYHCGLHPNASEWQHYWALFQPRAHWEGWLEWNRLDEGIGHLVLPDESSLELLEQLFRQLTGLREARDPYADDLRHNRLELTVADME